MPTMKPDPIASEFFEALTKVSRKIRTAFNQRVMAHGLTYPRARALFRLAKKQNMTQSELACELELEQATMVRLLDRMEENGLIERRPDPNDRRVKLLFLTVHGEEQASLVSSIADHMREQIFQDIDAEQVQVAMALFERITANIGEMEDIDVPA
ncbi:MarR family winged helix-turn-helix transcriptional regulator [Neorhizobium sp. T6_25]|jgi:MarR family transcriptional regulator for hemolysin|uniref:MarR family winged helix-turn-helix transcriptional regulator n=1 Tax=Neorhizobium sp. T6_25 TaxID=2093833 RepID=UPI000CF8F010|nr:MarR family transcriptional regulator [Neorhizobium sp. T6_25]